MQWWPWPTFHHSSSCFFNFLIFFRCSAPGLATAKPSLIAPSFDLRSHRSNDKPALLLRSSSIFFDHLLGSGPVFLTVAVFPLLRRDDNKKPCRERLPPSIVFDLLLGCDLLIFSAVSLCTETRRRRRGPFFNCPHAATRSAHSFLQWPFPWR